MTEQNNDAEVREEAELTLKHDTDEYGEMMRLVGIVQRGEMDRGYNLAVNAMTYKRIKESRFHNRLGMTWEDFCSFYLNKPRRAVEELIDNLNTFGIEFLEKAETLKISRSMFRQFRGLPEPDQERVKALVEAGQIEEVREIYEERLAEKESDVKKLRQEKEKAFSETDKAETALHKTEVEVEKSRKVIADLTYIKTQLAGDDKRCAEYLRYFLAKVTDAVSHLRFPDFDTLNIGQQRILYACIQAALDQFRELAAEFEKKYPDAIMLDELRMSELKDFNVDSYADLVPDEFVK